MEDKDFVPDELDVTAATDSSDEPKSKAKVSKEDKAKLKYKKIEAKRLKKEEQQKMFKDLSAGYKKLESKEEVKKNLKNFRTKKIKERVDVKLAIREFPIKVIKEIQKVRWPKQALLGSRLLWVLGFIFVLAVIFYFVDWGIQELFGLAKII